MLIRVMPCFLGKVEGVSRGIAVTTQSRGRSKKGEGGLPLIVCLFLLLFSFLLLQIWGAWSPPPFQYPCSLLVGPKDYSSGIYRGATLLFLHAGPLDKIGKDNIETERHVEHKIELLQY